MAVVVGVIVVVFNVIPVALSELAVVIVVVIIIIVIVIVGIP